MSEGNGHGKQQRTKVVVQMDKGSLQTAEINDT